MILNTFGSSFVLEQQYPNTWEGGRWWHDPRLHGGWSVERVNLGGGATGVQARFLFWPSSVNVIIN